MAMAAGVGVTATMIARTIISAWDIGSMEMVDISVSVQKKLAYVVVAARVQFQFHLI